MIFPSTLTQAALAGKSGWLTIASGNAHDFALYKTGKGNGKTIATFKLNLKRQTIAFKITKDISLNGLIAALPGFPSALADTKSFKLDIPVMISIDDNTYPVGVTFVVQCTQTGAKIKGTTATAP